MFSTVVLPYINFFLFLGIIYYFGRGPARESARKKREEYEKLFEQAQYAKREAEKKLVETNRQFENLNKELDRIRAQSIEESREEAQRIIQAGKDFADHLIAESERIASNEASKAQVEMQTEILSKVRKNVEVALKTKLDASNHKKILDKTLSYIS